jgi:hypothetical protein
MLQTRHIPAGKNIVAFYCFVLSLIIHLSHPLQFDCVCNLDPIVFIFIYFFGFGRERDLKYWEIMTRTSK